VTEDPRRDTRMRATQSQGWCRVALGVGGTGGAASMARRPGLPAVRRAEALITASAHHQSHMRWDACRLATRRCQESEAMNAEDPLDAQSPSFNITPTLFLGSPPPQLSTSVVSSSAEAVAVIRAGGSAVLPANRWDLADEVLVAFGASRARRASALMFVQHGVVLPLQALSESELDAALRGLSTRTGQSGSLCEMCGFFEASSVEAMRDNCEAPSLRECPVCHGEGLPFDSRL